MENVCFTIRITTEISESNEVPLQKEGQWPIGTVLIFLYEYSIFFMVVPFLGGT